MNCIKILTDEDFGLNRVDFNNPRIRYGARGIIVRNDGINLIKMNISYLAEA